MNGKIILPAALKFRGISDIWLPLNFIIMKKILFAALPVVAIVTLALRSISDPLAIGSSIPNAETKMKDISGKEISFKDAMKKNGLLVMFSCNTCPVVHKYETRTVEVCKEALDNNIGVILLNSNEASRDKGDSYDDMKKYAEKLGYSFYYAVDKNSEMADLFGATRTPECFLFNKDGKLAYHGAIDDNAANTDGTVSFMKPAIKKLTKGEKIDPEKTKSVGCTIKRL
jgi:thioredoxin-related protein